MILSTVKYEIFAEILWYSVLNILWKEICMDF